MKRKERPIYIKPAPVHLCEPSSSDSESTTMPLDSPSIEVGSIAYDEISGSNFDRRCLRKERHPHEKALLA